MRAEERFDRRGGDCGEIDDGDEGMTRGFSLLLPVMAVEFLPSTDDSWTMLVTFGAETPGSSLTVTPRDRMGDVFGESMSLLSTELSSVVLLLLFIFIEFFYHATEKLMFWSDQGYSVLCDDIPMTVRKLWRSSFQ